MPDTYSVPLTTLVREFHLEPAFLSTDYESIHLTVEDVAREVDRACRECGKLYFIPGASQGLAVSTFPGVYEETTRQIELASKKYF